MVIAYAGIIIAVYAYAKICAKMQCWVLNRIDAAHYGEYRTSIFMVYPAAYVLIHRLVLIIMIHTLDTCLQAFNDALLTITNEYAVGVLAFAPIGILAHTSMTTPSYLYGMLCQKCRKYSTMYDRKRMAIFTLSHAIYFFSHIRATTEYVNHASMWINGLPY